MSRSSRRVRISSAQRDAFVIASDDLLRSLSDVEDSRTWFPYTPPSPRFAYPQARLLGGQPARLVVAPVSRSRGRVRGAGLPQAVAFRVPRETIHCVRRRMRREVLFARRKTVKGSRSPRKRNVWSDVRC